MFGSKVLQSVPEVPAAPQEHRFRFVWANWRQNHAFVTVRPFIY